MNNYIKKYNNLPLISGLVATAGFCIVFFVQFFYYSEPETIERIYVYALSITKGIAVGSTLYFSLTYILVSTRIDNAKRIIKIKNTSFLAILFTLTILSYFIIFILLRNHLLNLFPNKYPYLEYISAIVIVVMLQTVLALLSFEIAFRSSKNKTKTKQHRQPLEPPKLIVATLTGLLAVFFYSHITTQINSPILSYYINNSLYAIDLTPENVHTLLHIAELSWLSLVFLITFSATLLGIKNKSNNNLLKTILAAFTSLTIHLSLTFAFIFCWIYFFAKQTLLGSLEAPMILPISSIILVASLFISSWLTSRLFLNAKLPEKSTNFFYENNNK